jgi:microcystin-dependent protein
MINNMDTLTYPTINGLKSLNIDELVATDIDVSNIDGNFFSIGTIEAYDVQVDAELHLTNNGFIIVGKGTASQVIVTDDEVKHLAGMQSNIQAQINTVQQNIDNVDTDKTADIATNTTNISILDNDLNLLEVDVGLNIQRIDDLEYKTERIKDDGPAQFVSIAGSGMRYYRNDDTYIGQIGGVNTNNNTLYISGNQIDDVWIYPGPASLYIYGAKAVIGSPWGCELQFTSDNSIQSSAFTNEIKTQIETNTAQIETNTAQIDVNTGNSGVPVGTILITAHPPTVAPPSGYHFCDGELKSKSSYSALFNLIGDTYAYDKPLYSSHFYLPDLRQLFVRGSQMNQTYPVSAIPVGMGQYQGQQIQKHGHEYRSANTSETVDKVNAPSQNQTVGSNNYTDNITTTMYDGNNIEIMVADTETRPESISMNYMIKY